MLFDTTSQWPELIAATTCVLSQYQLSRGKKSGWVWGIAASIFTGAFFLSSGASMLALFEGIGIIFSLYGLLRWKFASKKMEKLDVLANFFALSILIFYFFWGEKESFWFLQGLASATFLFGENLIARNRNLGWYLCILGDVIVGFLLLEAGSYTFFTFQLFSVSIGVFKVYPIPAFRLRYFRATVIFLYLQFYRLEKPVMKLSAKVASYSV